MGPRRPVEFRMCRQIAHVGVPELGGESPCSPQLDFWVNTTRRRFS
jgi:hypothetical protein